MFTIEKNDLLLSNKLVRYAKNNNNGKATITVRPDVESGILRIKIRITNLPIENKVTFDLIEIPMSASPSTIGISKKDFWETEEIPINFHFNPNIDSEKDANEIISIISELLDGIKDIILRWVADDGLYFLLSNDASKHIPLLVDMHYQEFLKADMIPENMSELDIKKNIEEQLSEFYCNHVSSFEELEPMVKLSEVTSNNIYKHNTII